MLSRPAAHRIRTVSGAIAAVALVGIALFSFTPKDLELQGIVEENARFSMTAQAGEVTWTEEQHGQAAGLRIVNQGSLQLDNGEQLQLEVTVDSGARVNAGDPIATIDSERNRRVLDELESERNALQARLDLVLEGGRSETIAAASKQVEVARAQLAAAQRELTRFEAMENTAAVAGVEADTARALVQIRERELALALAQVSEARLPPRAAEVAELEAMLAGVDSRLVEARQRQAASTVISPVTGIVGPGDIDELLEVTADGDRYVRVPVPQADVERVHVGDNVEFEQGETASPGRVIDIATQAQPLGAQSVFWVAVLLDPGAAVAPGATGTAHFLGQGS